ncbi:MAG TPA: hypothetical protein VFI47_26790 [Acidimicrobiales bacterium]|nr:hypothetical protein [Acidimicrobiales bacterium]
MPMTAASRIDTSSMVRRPNTPSAQPKARAPTISITATNHT